MRRYHAYVVGQERRADLKYDCSEAGLDLVFDISHKQIYLVA